MKRRDNFAMVRRSSFSDISKECSILQMLKHKNIVKVEEYFEDIEKTYLVLEYADYGTLEQLIEKGTLSET